MTKGPRNWSVSAARLYLDCPWAFWAKYVERIPTAKADIPLHWRLGTVCHAGLEAAYKTRRSERDVGPMMTDSVWGAAKSAIAASWAEEKMPAPAQSDGMWDRVHAMVENTLEDQSEAWEDIVDVEHKFFLRAGMNIIGFADLLLSREAGVYRNRDWKSRSTPTPPEALRRDFQGRLYSGLIYRLFPDAERVEFSHYYPPIATEVVVEITREEGEEAISRLRSVRDMVHHETEWPTNKGSKCSSCAFKPHCPAWRDQVKTDEAAAIAAQVGMF